MISEIDKDGSGTIDVEEFLDMMRKKMLEEKNLEEEMDKAFYFFDDTGDGFIDLKKLKKVVADLGEEYDEDLLNTMITSADID